MPATLPAIVLKVGSLVEVHGYHFYELHDFFLTAIVTKIEESFSEGWQCIFIEIVGERRSPATPLRPPRLPGRGFIPRRAGP